MFIYRSSVGVVRTNIGISIYVHECQEFSVGLVEKTWLNVFFFQFWPNSLSSMETYHFGVLQIALFPSAQAEDVGVQVVFR